MGLFPYPTTSMGLFRRHDASREAPEKDAHGPEKHIWLFFTPIHRAGV